MSEGIKSLSEREKAALQLLFEGHDAKSIAHDLNISIHTVNDRLREARRKLGVSSSREAARLLARTQNDDPNSLVPKKFGLAEQGIPSQHVEHPHHVAGGNHLFGWLAGGLLMLSLIVAAALFASHGSEGSTLATPVAVNGTDAKAGDMPASASVGSAQEWLAIVDDQNWTESWRRAGTIFRSQISENGWASAILAVRQPLGAVASRSLAKVTKTSSLPGTPAGQYELLEFKTDFAFKRGAVETVVLAKEPLGWRVDGYFIR